MHQFITAFTLPQYNNEQENYTMTLFFYLLLAVVKSLNLKIKN